jgi:hypothetical protein
MIYAFGLLVIILLQNNKYDWMREVDTSVPIHAIEDASGNNAIAVVLLLIVIVSVQLILAIKTKRILARTVSVALVLLAFGVWGSRFLV